MILKRILSILFLILSLITMYITYIFLYVTSPILPNIFDIGSLLIPILLVLLSIWFLCKTFNIKKGSRKGILTFCLFVFFVISIYFGSKMYRNYLDSIFDKERWDNEPDVRALMVDNMIMKYKLVGMSKEEVTELLGEPTDTDYFTTPTNYIYYLGPERGFLSIDSEWLIIEFDRNGKVNEYRVTAD